MGTTAYKTVATMADGVEVQAPIAAPPPVTPSFGKRVVAQVRRPVVVIEVAS